MDNKALVAAIDEEVATLEKVKALLGGVARRGRKPGSATAFTFGANTPKKKRTMSAGARAKIRAAQKKRWAAWYKTHPKKQLAR
jgi:hypothetical protein